jgi:hypothetical protein
LSDYSYLTSLHLYGGTSLPLIHSFHIKLKCDQRKIFWNQDMWQLALYCHSTSHKWGRLGWRVLFISTPNICILIYEAFMRLNGLIVRLTDLILDWAMLRWSKIFGFSQVLPFWIIIFGSHICMNYWNKCEWFYVSKKRWCLR